MTNEKILQEIKRLKEEAYNDCQNALEACKTYSNETAVKLIDINSMLLKKITIDNLLKQLEKFIKGEKK